MIVIKDYIEIVPGIRSGKSIFKGTRITVADILNHLASGMSIEDVVEDFPPLTINHLKAAFLYAAEMEKGTNFLPAA
jgi:uncharacterized protein (DUF433 family)